MDLEFDYVRPSQTIWEAKQIFKEINIFPCEVVKVILTKKGVEELWYQKDNDLFVWDKRGSHFSKNTTIHLTKESAIQRAVNEGRKYIIYG